MTLRRTAAAESLQPRRAALLLTALVAMGVLAILGPPPVSEGNELATVVALRVGPMPRMETEAVVLGELVGRELRLRIKSLDGVRVYDVFSLDGQGLGENIPDAELFSKFPQLQLDTLTLECPDKTQSAMATMLADVNVGD